MTISEALNAPLTPNEKKIGEMWIENQRQRLDETEMQLRGLADPEIDELLNY